MRFFEGSLSWVSLQAYSKFNTYLQLLYKNIVQKSLKISEKKKIAFLKEFKRKNSFKILLKAFLILCYT